MQETEQAVETAVGDPVLYVDPTGEARPALVTAVFGSGGTRPSLNVAYIDPSEDSRDSYGRQIKRSTSTPHRTNQQAPGNYWMLYTER